MNDSRIRIRANRSLGELEVEGPINVVEKWWEKLWPELETGHPTASAPALRQPARLSPPPAIGNGQVPDVFGEFYSEFRTDITDVDKVLVAGAFVQVKESDRVFSTKAANQLLIDQNVKVANASECVRRLTSMKRAFVVSSGRFRISASGFEYLETLKVTNES